ncbi:MAG: hypothetical protein JXB60_00755 [Candidatus Cloacimonetes bacterium]|nr:hypothetical protein [Candidatus Cloacimonadota bacterium]
MEAKDDISLSAKIEKLVTNYLQIKDEFDRLKIRSAELEKENLELKSHLTGTDSTVIEYEKKIKHQIEEIEILRQENHNLRQQLEDFEKNNQEAISRLDGILGRIDDL